VASALAWLVSTWNVHQQSRRVKLHLKLRPADGHERQAAEHFAKLDGIVATAQLDE